MSSLEKENKKVWPLPNADSLARSQHQIDFLMANRSCSSICLNTEYSEASQPHIKALDLACFYNQRCILLFPCEHPELTTGLPNQDSGTALNMSLCGFPQTNVPTGGLFHLRLFQKLFCSPQGSMAFSAPKVQALSGERVPCLEGISAKCIELHLVEF